MNKKLKLFLGISYLLILFTFLYFIFTQIEISRLNDFSYYKELQFNIDRFIGDKLYTNLIIFFLFTIIWIALLGFGSPLLIISGILFGKWIGTAISLLSISIGALILYSLTNFFFKDLINKILEKKFSKYIDLFKKNEFYYFFVFRLSGGVGIPFPLQNTLPVIFNMNKMNYFFSSLLGFVPGVFIFNSIGFGINKFIKEADSFSFVDLIFSKEIYFPIIIFIIFLVISLLIKKKFFNVRNK
ncbi:VTT domain-containing protein [Pelagibacteraceae bacterium]|nr:VTT domain-containing protein [Pelagibacteraceae bacterium]